MNFTKLFLGFLICMYLISPCGRPEEKFYSRQEQALDKIVDIKPGRGLRAPMHMA